MSEGESKDLPFSGWSLMSPSLGWFGLSDCPDSVERERQREKWDFGFISEKTQTCCFCGLSMATIHKAQDANDKLWGNHPPACWPCSLASGMQVKPYSATRTQEGSIRDDFPSWLRRRPDVENSANIIHTNQRRLSLSSRLTSLLRRERKLSEKPTSFWHASQRFGLWIHTECAICSRGTYGNKSGEKAIGHGRTA